MLGSLPATFGIAVSSVLGLVIGSFLNVVIARLPAGASVVRPSSRCPRCERAIRWYENLPVLSFLALRGRCRGCREKISWRYPLVELLTAALFGAAAARFGFDALLLMRDLPFLAILVAVTFIDWDHRIIPDPLSLGGLGLGLATGWATPGLGWMSSLGGAALGFGLFYGFAWLYFQLTGRSGMGGGDIKLLAMLGSFLGPFGVLMTIFLSSITGSIGGIAWGLWRRSRGSDAALMKVAIPYGPFLVLGALVYYFLGDILWLLFTNPT